jgi:uncharacterized protein
VDYARVAFSPKEVDMSEHPNATLYRTAMTAMMSSDPSAGDYFSDDLVWWQIGSPEPIRGKQNVMEAMSAYAGVDFEVDIHDVVANDEHVVGLVEATVRTGDDVFTYRAAEIAHVKDGKFTERWAFSDDTQRIIDFFSRFE